MSGQALRAVRIAAGAVMAALLVALYVTGALWIPGAIYLATSAFALAHAYRSDPPEPYGLFLTGVMFAAGIGWLLWQTP